MGDQHPQSEDPRLLKAQRALSINPMEPNGPVPPSAKHPFEYVAGRKIYNTRVKQDQPIKNMDFYRLHMRHICSVRQIRPERRNEETHQRQNKEAQRLPAPQQQ